MLHGVTGQLNGLGDPAHLLVLVLLAHGQELGILRSAGSGQDQGGQLGHGVGDLAQLIRRVVNQGRAPQLAEGFLVLIQDLEGQGQGGGGYQGRLPVGHLVLYQGQLHDVLGHGVGESVHVASLGVAAQKV